MKSKAMTQSIDVPRLITPIPGPKSSALHERKTQSVSHGVGVTLPVYITNASDGVLEDIDGNVFIDFGSGIGVTGVGNANSEVVHAISEQAKNFTHTAFAVTPYENYVHVCEKLNSLTPGTFTKKSALFNSGAEAVENAVKIARYFTKRQAIVVLENGYHGRTNLTMAMTAKAMPFKQGFGPFAPEVYRLPGSYPLRDGLSGEEAALKTLTKLEKEIGTDQVAAIVFEPVQGEGGFIVPAEGYLSAIEQFCREKEILLIADEIQSGFCRTGKWFASEYHDVTPDIIITAKGIAGGMPLSAVTGREDVMDSIHPGGLGGTYTGNPVSCAAALAAIYWMENVNANGLALGIQKKFFEALSKVKEQTSVIAETRGLGAMVAIEIVTEGTLLPDPSRASKIAQTCHQQGLVVLVTGTFGNVIRFLPPLSIPHAVLDKGLDILVGAIKES